MIYLDYFGSLKEFKSACKRYGLLTRLKDNKIVVSKDNVSVSIELAKQKVPNRSFSTAFFNIDGYKLALDEDANLSILEDLKNICLEYTDIELKSIFRDMPLLSQFASKHKGNMKNVAIVWRDHFLEENIGLLNCFIDMGVLPQDILAIDKGDSTLHQYNIKNSFKKMGIITNILDNSIIADIDKHIEKTQFVFDFIESRLDKKLLVIDDGALVTKILNKKYENIVAVLELTEMGLRRIKLMQDNLIYPVLNVAKTTLKRKLTYPEISNSIFLRVLELIGAEKLVGRNVLLLGYGDMGEILADRLRAFGMKVNIYDPDIMRLIIAGEKGFKTYKDSLTAVKNCKPILTIGASGYNSITEEMVKYLPKYAFVTAGATADLSYFKQYEDDPKICNKVENLGSQYKLFNKQITILGNGRSVNLFGSEAIPNRANDIFKTAIALTACNAILNQDILKDSLELNLVEEWINQSDILQNYYDMYIGD